MNNPQLTIKENTNCQGTLAFTRVALKCVHTDDVHTLVLMERMGVVKTNTTSSQRVPHSATGLQPWPLVVAGQTLSPHKKADQSPPSPPAINEDLFSQARGRVTSGSVDLLEKGTASSSRACDSTDLQCPRRAWPASRSQWGLGECKPRSGIRTPQCHHGAPSS